MITLFHLNNFDMIDKLIKIDPMHIGYYQDILSENTLKNINNFQFSDQNLTSKFYFYSRSKFYKKVN
jgi:hypothetical protein